MSRGKSGETVTAAMLDEGARTMGVWLPLALADLKRAILAPWLKKEDFEPLSRTLAGWCLPMMSRALAAEEREQDAIALFNSIQQLADKQNAKAEAEAKGNA